MRYVRAREWPTVMQNKDPAEDFHLQGLFILAWANVVLLGRLVGRGQLADGEIVKEQLGGLSRLQMGLKANGSCRVRLGVLVLELIFTVIPNLMNAIEICNGDIVPLV